MIKEAIAQLVKRNDLTAETMGEVMEGPAGLRSSLFGIFTSIPLNFSLGLDEIDLPYADARVDLHRMHHCYLQGPGGIMADDLAVWTALETPAHISKSGGDMGVDA